MSQSPREELAERQLRLVQSLQNAAIVPECFDPQWLGIARLSLFQKRMRAVQKTWPALVQYLGDEFAGEFTIYVTAHPLLPAGGAIADGLAFARDLGRRRKLPMQLRWSLFLRRRKMPSSVVIGFILASVVLTGCASHPDPTILHPELAVVKITTLSSDPGLSSEARGFFVTSDGLIITCLHNVGRKGAVVVTPAKGQPLQPEIVQEDVEADLALIRIPGQNRPFLHLFQGDVLPGMHVRAVGSDGVTHGVFDHWENFGKEISFTARIGVSDSGAPLLGDDGQVIGVAKGIVPDRPNANVAIPIWHVLQMMPALPSMQAVKPSQ